jgi:hypothetical protein
MQQNDGKHMGEAMHWVADQASVHTHYGMRYARDAVIVITGSIY